MIRIPEKTTISIALMTYDSFYARITLHYLL